MARRYSRRYGYRPRSKAQWARYHVQQREEVSRKFGGIDRDVEAAFLALDSHRLEFLLRKYGAKFGDKAEAYARETYGKWKSRSVRMSGQTAERLLDLLPPQLSPAERLALVKKLRLHYLQVDRIAVTTSIRTWREVVIPAVQRVIEKAKTQNLPQAVTQVATWLASDDARAAQALLASAEAEEARIRTSLLEHEFARLDALAARFVDAEATFEHTIKIPNGEIRVLVAPPPRPRKGLLSWLWGGTAMSNENERSPDALVKASSGGAIVKRPDSNLLDVATDGLSSSELQALRGKAVEEKLRLDVSAREADHRFVNSSRDMANTVRMANELDQGRNDYSIDANYETASGRTNVRVKRATNQSFLIIAIVVAVIVLLIVLNR